MTESANILVPTDFSEQSDEALRRAGELARLTQGHVHLLHVLEPTLYFETDLISTYPIDAMMDSVREGVERRLSGQAASADFPVTTHKCEALGDPSRAICDVAAQLPADLIVIGRHGQQGVIDRMLIGSTAERVVRHAPCSVLVAMPHGLFGGHQEQE